MMKNIVLKLLYLSMLICSILNLFVFDDYSSFPYSYIFPYNKSLICGLMLCIKATEFENALVAEIFAILLIFLVVFVPMVTLLMLLNNSKVKKVCSAILIVLTVIEIFINIWWSISPEMQLLDVFLTIIAVLLDLLFIWLVIRLKAKTGSGSAFF